MATHRTSKQARIGKLRLFLMLIVVATVIGAVGWVWNNQEPDQNSQETTTVGSPPLVQQIVAATSNRPLSIEAIIPALSEEQQWYKWLVEQVLDDPERWVQKDPLSFSENDRQLFISLILTESSFSQFDDDGSTLDSGIDCDGLAQICANPALMDPAMRWNPMENVYAGARYFEDLIEKWDGDYSMAVAEYKGALNKMPDGRTIPNPDHPAVQSVFANIRLR